MIRLFNFGLILFAMGWEMFENEKNKFLNLIFENVMIDFSKKFYAIGLGIGAYPYMPVAINKNFDFFTIFRLFEKNALF